MRRVAVVSSILFLHPIATGSDLWFGEDKKLHFVGSGILAAAIKETTGNDNLGFAVSLSIGMMKEYYDYKHPTKHTASYKDLLWDIGGSTLGSYSKNCSIDYHNGEVIVKYTWVLK